MILSVLLRFLLYTLVVLFLTQTFFLADSTDACFFSLLLATAAFYVLQLAQDVYSERFPETRISTLPVSGRIILFALLAIYTFVVVFMYHGYFETIGLHPPTNLTGE